MTQAAVGSDVNQPFDISRDLAAQVTLNLVGGLDALCQFCHLVVREVFRPFARIDVGGREHLARCDPADSEEVRQGDFDALLFGNIDPHNSRHDDSPVPGDPALALALLMLGIRANDTDDTLSPDDFTLAANTFH
jgi:hypothetical protein